MNWPKFLSFWKALETSETSKLIQELKLHFTPINIYDLRPKLSDDWIARNRASREGDNGNT